MRLRPICVVGSLGLYELSLRGFWVRAPATAPSDSAAAIGVGRLFHRRAERPFIDLPRLRPAPWRPGPSAQRMASS